MPDLADKVATLSTSDLNHLLFLHLFEHPEDWYTEDLGGKHVRVGDKTMHVASVNYVATASGTEDVLAKITEKGFAVRTLFAKYLKRKCKTDDGLHFVAWPEALLVMVKRGTWSRDVAEAAACALYEGGRLPADALAPLLESA